MVLSPLRAINKGNAPGCCQTCQNRGSMSRIHVAFVLYIALAGIAGSSLRGDFRLAVWILLAGLALKTWIGHKKEEGTGVGPNDSTMGGATSGEPPQTKES